MVTKKMFQANRDSTIRMKALLQDLSDQQLLSVMPNGWSVSVTLAHLAFWDNRVIHLIESSKKEGKVNPSNFEDSINDIMEPFLRAIPAAEAAAKVYEEGVAAGWGEEDFSAVIKVLRK